jgi:glycosyltransferase involved in cell wall biosynthesis
MRFSIIIPVYNVEPYLRQCLDSVLGQTFCDWEAVCVNDGSTDGSASILEEYANRDSRIKVITQGNGGLSAARNKGLSVARGDYVLFLDSDDCLERNALEVLSENLKDEDLLCFSGRRYFEDQQTFNDPDRLKRHTYSAGMDYYNENALQPRDFAFVCVVLRAYKRAFLSENHLRFKEGIFHEDNLFTPIACFYAKKVKVINACLYNYRVRSHSITSTNDMKHLKDFLGIANDLAAFFVSETGFDKTVVYRAITHHYQVVFLNVGKDNRKELKHLCDWQSYKKVSRTKPRHRLNYLRNKMI